MPKEVTCAVWGVGEDSVGELCHSSEPQSSPVFFEVTKRVFVCLSTFKHWASVYADDGDADQPHAD